MAQWEVKEFQQHQTDPGSYLMGLPRDGAVVKNPPANAGNAGSIHGSGRSSGRGNGNPLQYSCLENLTDRETWQATVQRVKKSQTQLSNTTTTKPLKRKALGK